MEVEDIQRQFTKFRRIGNNGGRSSSDSSSKIIDIGGNQKGEVKLDQLEAGVHLADEEEQEARSGGGRVVVKRSGGMTMDMVVGGGGRLCGWPSSRIVRVSRASGGKDRHSKVLTSKGLRDRRVRLSVSTAIQFYDLQDRLGYEQPSKAVEWLLKAASSSINELPSLDASFSNKNDKSGDAELDLDLDDLTTNYNHCHHQQQNRKCSSTSETSKISGGLSLSRSEIRIKARERARERAAVDKEKGKENIIIVNDEFTATATATATTATAAAAAAAAAATATADNNNNNNNNDADYNNKDDDVMNQSHHRRHVNLGISRNASSFTDLLTGGISISRRVSNNNNNNGTTSTPEINSPRDYEFFTVPTSSSGPLAETSQQQYQHQQNHGHHHPELHHFSFLQENFFHPVVTAGETNYNLNFSISSGAGLAGFNRGTLQSNLVPSSLFPHIHQRLIPSIVDGASNLPFLVGATTASAAVSSNDPDNPFPDSYDARLQLCYGDSVTAAAAAADHRKGKGKS